MNECDLITNLSIHSATLCWNSKRNLTIKTYQTYQKTARRKKLEATYSCSVVPVNVCSAFQASLYSTSRANYTSSDLNLMENESLWSTIPRWPRSPLGLQLPTRHSRQDGSEIELLKDRLAELERRLDESQNKIRAKLLMLQRTIHQRTREVEHLPENESHANIQFQVGGCCKKNQIVSNHDNTCTAIINGTVSRFMA